MVFTESYFSDGKRCQNSRIEVFDTFGNKVLEGRTDKNGDFSFKPSKRTDLRIVLTASMGHKDEYVIPARELPEGPKGKVSKPQLHETARESLQPGREGDKRATVGQLTRLEMEQIRTGIGEAPKPIRRILVTRGNEGISFIRVMAGIGFILGMMGIILYVRSKRGRGMEGSLHGS
jgi:nickel transport protein